MYMHASSKSNFCTGYLLGNMPTEGAPVISKEHICEGQLYSVYTMGYDALNPSL